MKKVFMTLIAISFVSLGFSQPTPNPCTGVVADFTTETLAAAGGIKFTDATTNSGSTVLIYNWTFNNGYTSTEKDPFSVFDEGIYTVKLTVSDDSGCETIIQKEIEFSYGGN
jgi:PKD repeat protein